ELLNLSQAAVIAQGDYSELHSHNINGGRGYNDSLFAFVRATKTQQWLVISNFSSQKTGKVRLSIPLAYLQAWEVSDSSYNLHANLAHDSHFSALTVNEDGAEIELELAAYDSLVLELVREELAPK